MNLIRKTIKLYQKDPVGVFSIALVWCVIFFLCIAMGQIIGLTPFLYIFMVIPATISLRFIYFTFSMGKPINYHSFKIGFVTFISSIKLYFRMIKEGLIISVLTFVAGLNAILVTINITNKAEAQLLKDIINGDNSTTPWSVLFSITWVKYALIILAAICIIIYYLYKFKFNFLPYIAFQSPIDAKSAKSMGSMMVKRNYIGYVLINATALIFVVLIVAFSYSFYKAGVSNELFTKSFSFLLAIGVGCFLYAPVLGFYGLMNAIFYNISSVPFQNQINKALDKLLKELKSLEESNNIQEDQNQNKKDE